ncbi:MAG: ZIP family metal transporter, partial [Clostridia bacterium]|nr:ZIP family metal transporter [Clostridia bacterium]
MDWIMWGGILLPFIGTSFGAAGVYFLKKSAERKRGEILAGFSSGIMAAAPVWSLLPPATERTRQSG